MSIFPEWACSTQFAIEVDECSTRDECEGWAAENVLAAASGGTEILTDRRLVESRVIVQMKDANPGHPTF
jgi:hypothetical protein